MGPLVGIAQGAALERDAADFEREAVEPTGAGDVRNDPHTPSLQGLDKGQHRLRAGSEDFIQNLLQLQPRRLLAGAHRQVDLPFPELPACRQGKSPVVTIGWPPGDREMVQALQLLDDAGAAQVLVAPEVDRAAGADAAGDEVYMLALRVVMQHVDARVIRGEPHACEVVVADALPLLRRQGFAGRQTQGVVPDGLADVRTQGAHGRKFAGELAHVGTGHRAADEHAGAVFVILVAAEDIPQDPLEPGTPLDPIHPLHSPSSCLWRAVISALRSSTSMDRISPTSGNNAPDSRALLMAAAIWLRLAPTRASCCH